MALADLTKIPRGNTVANVNREIIEYLLLLKADFADESFLDIPCGEGEFLCAVKMFFPAVETVGGDIKSPTDKFFDEFLPIDAQKNFSLHTAKKFRIITCISGVCEFDNRLLFFLELRKNLAENGVLLVTNDNLLTVRDRFLYLFFGRFRQYRQFISDTDSTWNYVPFAPLRRLLVEAGLEIVEIKYVTPKIGEWIWLPLALPIYLLQMIYLLSVEKEIGFTEKTKRLPFISLLARHYFIVCRLKR